MKKLILHFSLVLGLMTMQEVSAGKQKGKRGKSINAPQINNSDGEPQWFRHKNKHMPPKNKSWKQIVESTQKGAAKYKYNNVEELERNVWLTGTVCIDCPWKIKNFEKIIGASGGKETSYVRVELDTTKSIHGHPITSLEFVKLLKKREQILIEQSDKYKTQTHDRQNHSKSGENCLLAHRQVKQTKQLPNQRTKV